MYSLFLLYTQYVLICHCVVDETQQKAIDIFYDENDSTNWVILSGDVTDEFAKQWDENEKWDTINENIETKKGHFVIRKCENVFGNALCLCQFVKLVGEQHNCHQNTPRELKKQKMLRTAYAMRYNTKNKLSQSTNMMSNARETIQNHLNRMAAKIKSHPLFNRFWGSTQQKKDEKKLEVKEKKIENEIVAAKIENEENELTKDELDEIKDEVNEFMEEKEELEEDEEIEAIKEEEEEEEEEEDEEEGEEEEDEGKTADDVIEEAAAQEAYDDEIINVLDQEVDTQNELIEKQSELIQELKEDNAMKEELIQELDEESDNDQEDEEEYDDEEDEEQDDDEEDDDDEILDDDDDIMDDNDDNAANDAYYDNAEDDESLAKEDYNALYDVDDDDDNDDNDDELNDDYQDETERDLEKKEADAMIADTFWGLEIYSVAFGVLLCFCICCYLQKTKCCGYYKQKQPQQFGYAAYGQQGGFKRVFGAVDDGDDDDDDHNDVEIGDVDQNDEHQMLHS